MSIFKRKRKKRTYHDVAPDEIFLDAHNSPQFNQQQFEGRIEKPIPKQTIFFLIAFFMLIGVIFIGKLGSLQVVEGNEYFQRSERNSLDRQPIFADRGVIFDRNGVPLAWNSENTEDEFPLRMYTDLRGLAHVVGYVNYPQRDRDGFYWQDYFVGKAGIEKSYNSTLQGQNGSKLLERDAQGNVRTENMVDRAIDGESVTLSIDAHLQNTLYEAIVSLADEGSYEGGAGVIMDTDNGELLALTSYPEYDPTVISRGEAGDTIESYFQSSQTPLLNRPTSGLYTPGSTVKPFLAMGVLNEELIDPNREIESDGSISIPNPYNPDQPTIFRDWRVHGYVDMRDALAVSSNTYFFEVGGGYEEQEGLGIAGINTYTRAFGVAEETGIPHFSERAGVIPNPEWKAQHFEDGLWRIGDTYNTAIGQYGFQVSPLQMTRAIGAIANGGFLVTPHVVSDQSYGRELIEPHMPDSYYTIVREGMRQAVTEGTAVYLNGSQVPAAAKTGTAELGIQKERVHSWIVGFFPYDDPQYAFAVLMERGPAEDTIGAARVMRSVLDWIGENRPEMRGVE